MANRTLSNILVKFEVMCRVQNTADDGVVASAPQGTVLNIARTSGVGDNQASRAINYEFTISSGVTKDIVLDTFAGEDIGAGTAKDALGQSWDMLELCTILIHNKTTSAGSLELNASVAASTILWVPSLTVANGGALPAGATFAKDAPTDAGGYDVSGARSTLRLTANGGDCDVKLTILGRHRLEESSSTLSSSSSCSSQSSSSSSSSSSCSSSLSSSCSSSLSSSSST